MARIGTMNLALHGISKPSISMDSLLEKGNADPLYGKFDVVLANPPFSGNLDYPATDGKILATCRTKKTELLFIALYLKLLKVGGVAASIIPDGVLFGSDKAHLGMRQELVEHQKLLAVVSMPQGVFSPYSPVKTSFIIFQKTDCGGTENVWFYNMQNDGFSLDAKRSPIEQNNIPDILERFANLDGEKARTRFDQSFFVSKKDLEANLFTLSFNKYRTIVKKEIKYRPEADIIFDMKETVKDISNDVAELGKNGSKQ
jgi:type I restriction enzyme M protein